MGIKISLLIIPFLFINTNTSIPKLVQEFHQLKTQKAEVQFIEKYKYHTDPSVLAYVISIEMKQAKYTFNPYDKLQIFKHKKQQLNQLIKQHNTNIHLRYVRLIIQENTPSFLGYYEDIETDKSFLKKKLDISDETDYLDVYIKAHTSL